MNFLAHAYLSFNNEELLVGNLIGDFVKGKSKDLFPKGIKKGIELHRFIDTFTDTHPVFLEAEKIFKPAIGLYSGAFLDIVFDYFLANDAHKNEQEWKDFSQYAYRTLKKYEQNLPEEFARIFPYMQQQNWLYNYRLLENIERAFHNLAKRAKYLTSADEAMKIFKKNIPQLEVYYQKFFPEIEEEVKKNFSRFSEE